ncbi:MAG: hypothetical protein M9963_11120 [Kiritimatiellae bacterium]|nr:hypothetical protein [Kiritimatiellia bacterium]
MQARLFNSRSILYPAANQKEKLMRRLLILLLGCSLALPALAADEALFGEDDTWSLFTRLDLKFSDFGGDSGFIGGAQIGGILNDKLAIGLAGYALLSEVDVAPNGYNNPEAFDLAYGGLALEYTLYSENLIHVSLGGVIAGGQIRLDRTLGGDDKKLNLFIIEPQFNLLLNITQRSELGIGIGYRHAEPSNENIEGLEKGDLSGLVGTLFVRFTEF